MRQFLTLFAREGVVSRDLLKRQSVNLPLETPVQACCYYTRGELSFSSATLGCLGLLLPLTGSAFDEGAFDLG